jgi:oligoendopeptidase F
VWRKLVVIFPLGLSIALLINGCEDQVSQCQRLIQVVNAGNSLIDHNKGQQVITSLQLSKDLLAITQALEDLNLSDPKLQEFQSSFASVFRNLSQAIAKASQALGTAKNAEISPVGREKLEQARTEIDTILTSAAQTAGKQSDALVDELNKYCIQPE